MIISNYITNIAYPGCLGCAPVLPEKAVKYGKGIASKIYGFTIAGMAMQASILAAKPLSLRNTVIISIGGGLATYCLGNKHAKTIFKAQQAANCLLGVVSLACGHYVFGLSALYFSGKILLENNNFLNQFWEPVNFRDFWK